MPCSNRRSVAIDDLPKGAASTLKAEHFLRFGGSLVVPPGPTEHQLGTRFRNTTPPVGFRLMARLCGGGEGRGGRHGLKPMLRPPSTSFVTIFRLRFAEWLSAHGMAERRANVRGFAALCGYRAAGQE